MRFWLSLLGGIVVLFVVVYLLSAVVGLLFWAGVALVILACIAGVLGYLTKEKQLLRSPGRLEKRRIEKTAEQALKDLEHKINKQ